MSTPNLFLIYVTDVERATAFYSDLFDMEPMMLTPRYVPFEIKPGLLFALWSGRSQNAVPTTPRTSEIGLMVPGSATAVDEVYVGWVAKGVSVIEEPPTTSVAWWVAIWSSSEPRPEPMRLTAPNRSFWPS